MSYDENRVSDLIDGGIFAMNEQENNAALEVGKFVSSNIEKPPFKIVVEVYTPFGYSNMAMFHASENDGYDFKNERPMVTHFIDDFETEVLWRLPDPYDTRLFGKIN